MKFAFEEFHLWYQFALSLMAAGKVSPFMPATLSRFMLLNLMRDIPSLLPQKGSDAIANYPTAFS